MDIYLVGGAVRDSLMDLPVKDRDWVVVGATAEQMTARGYQQVGKDFPVFLDPATGEEYALARTERKSGSGYTGFTVHADPDVTLEQDLARRDLTINAIAQAEDGSLIDPFGGRQDITDKILRHVSPAFSEDPLRVLRVARFAARFAHLGFTIADETLNLMRQIVNSGEMEHLVAERQWQELQRALTEKSPDIFFRVLRQCNALVRVLPELDRLFGVPQPVKYHPEIDTGVHTLMVLQQAVILSDDPVVRFAALVHDVGKGVTPPQRWPAHKGHEELGADLIHKLCTRLRIPNEYRDLAVMVSRYHTSCHRAQRHSAERIMETLENVDAFRRPHRFQQFLKACEADARGRKGLEQLAYPQAEILQKAQEAAAGIDAQNVIDDGFTNGDIGSEIRNRRIHAINTARVTDHVPTG